MADVTCSTEGRKKVTVAWQTLAGNPAQVDGEKTTFAVKDGEGTLSNLNKDGTPTGGHEIFCVTGSTIGAETIYTATADADLTPDQPDGGGIRTVTMEFTMAQTAPGASGGVLAVGPEELK